MKVLRFDGTEDLGIEGKYLTGFDFLFGKTPNPEANFKIVGRVVEGLDAGQTMR